MGIIVAIKQNISIDQNYNFSNTDVSNIIKETKTLNNKKNRTFGNISTTRLKDMFDVCTPPLNDSWNKETITQKIFQIILN